MATAIRIPIEQYLATSYEPDAEYVNGEIEERNVGEYDHNLVQWAILDWLRRHDKEWQTRSIQEQRTRLSAGSVRIPDVGVWARSVPIQPVFTHPPLIAIEVLSPEDRQSKMQERIDDYRRFGVLNVWIVDPVKRLGWNCSDGNWIRTDHFNVSDSQIFLDLSELFKTLDAAEA
ncbi:MAG TPA: Uma2 family endonuclease [Terracidiphilus sp.]|nr:Uma2 family endonuclease [Terracidiphilus sp.]